MEAELLALATAGATALVQQMATDGWTSVRDRVTGFLTGRGTASAEAVEADLDSSRAELTLARGADSEETAATTAEDLRTEWRNRLRRTLLADPESAAELRALLEELNPARPDRQPGDTHNTVSGGTVHGPVVQARDIGRLDLGPGGRG
ncbi:hypothetical protein ACIO1C_08990 [Streptomyces sp. NPDC087420]|uniref:hypothetical protein n=1 Tax=Streptomyces sp. NPDC087420 TaxID=3365785 RepID=UPI0038340753